MTVEPEWSGDWGWDGWGEGWGGGRRGANAASMLHASVAGGREKKREGAWKPSGDSPRPPLRQPEGSHQWGVQRGEHTA